MFLRKFLLIFALILSSSVFAIDKSAWNSNNDPDRLTPDTPTAFEYNFQKLPTEGQLDYMPWADTYWASYERGIAARWYGKSNIHITPYKDKVLNMSAESIKKLSPAEKYDIFVGDYEYSLTKSELNRTSPDDPQWEGLCHGWAPAAMLFQEPNAVTVENGEGIKIPFGSSDVKALLTYLQANSEAKSYMAGNRCNKDMRIVTSENKEDACLDINAGAFHIILANRIGIIKKGFVMDVGTGEEIWNQPVYAYDAKIVKTHGPTQDAAEGTVKEIEMDTLVTYIAEVPASFEVPDNNPTQKEYNYILELDKSNRIIGGKWISTDYPDFIWVQKKAKFTGKFKPLEEIYNASIR